MCEQGDQGDHGECTGLSDELVPRFQEPSMITGGSIDYNHVGFARIQKQDRTGSQHAAHQHHT